MQLACHTPTLARALRWTILVHTTTLVPSNPDQDRGSPICWLASRVPIGSAFIHPVSPVSLGVLLSLLNRHLAFSLLVRHQDQAFLSELNCRTHGAVPPSHRLFCFFSCSSSPPHFYSHSPHTSILGAGQHIPGGSLPACQLASLLKSSPSPQKHTTSYSHIATSQSFLIFVKTFNG